MTSLLSCNYITRQEAMQLNNTIVSINDSLYLKGRKFGTLVNESYKAKDYSQLQPFRINFEKFLDSSRKSMIGLKDIGGSESLKNCEIELLKIEKQMIEHDFVPFEHLTTSSTNDDVSALFDSIQNDAKGETDQMQKFKKLQEDYALRNGFTLSKNKVQ